MILSARLAQMDKYFKKLPANLLAKMDTSTITVFVKFVTQPVLNAMDQRMKIVVLALMVTL